MILVSPRFNGANCYRFEQVMNRQPIKKGEKGRAVNIVQVALADLGFNEKNKVIPLRDEWVWKSNGKWKKTEFSDDDMFDIIEGRLSSKFVFNVNGIMDDGTIERIRHFQQVYKLKATGLIDRETLFTLDKLLPGYQWQIKVHFRNFPGTKPWVEFDLAETQGVFGQYGIEINYAGGKVLRENQEYYKEFFSDNPVKCKILHSGKITKLNSLVRDIPMNEITIFYVKEVTHRKHGRVLGCAAIGGYGFRPAAFVDDKDRDFYTVAHEIGHMLSLRHETKEKLNVMNIRQVGNLPQVFNWNQIRKMRRSPCCIKI